MRKAKEEKTKSTLLDNENTQMQDAPISDWERKHERGYNNITINKNTSFLSLDRLYPYENNPYKVEDNEEMDELVKSIKQNGVLHPLLVRNVGGTSENYQIISGHRRAHAARLAGLTRVPVYTCVLTNEEAALLVVESNLQREHILPSEKAKAYKLLMDVTRHQGRATSRQLVGRLESADQVSNTESGRTVQRYLRLNNLIPGLLALVDEGRIAFTPAVELSYLSEEEQRNLLETIESEDCTPSLSQAQQMRKLSEQGKLDMDAVFQTMTKPKANQQEKVTLPYQKLPVDKIRRYTKTEPTPQTVQEFLLKAVEHYCKYLDRQKDKGDR